MAFTRTAAALCALALSATGLAVSQPVDHFMRLQSAHSTGDRVLRSEVERLTTMVGWCYVKRTDKRATGQYRYEDSGTRRALRVPVYEYRTTYSKGSAVLVFLERGARLHAVPELFDDHPDAAFPASAVAAAVIRAAQRVDQPLRWQSITTHLGPNGLAMTHRVHSHLGNHFVDSGSFIEWGFDVRSSTLGSADQRVFLVRQFCQRGGCAMGHDATAAPGETKRFCALVDAGTDVQRASATVTLDRLFPDR